MPETRRVDLGTCSKCDDHMTRTERPMAEHSIVFNMRVQMPGTTGDAAGQVSYEQMMNTFDKTRQAGRREGWQLALKALREEAAKRKDLIERLDTIIGAAARGPHCPFDTADAFPRNQDAKEDR